MHKCFVRAGQIVFMVTLLFSLSTLLLQPTALAQDEVSEIPAGDFRLVVREEFIVEQLETQFGPFIDNLSAYGLPMEDPAIDLRADSRIDVSVTTELPFGDRTVSMRPTVTVALAAVDNQMSLAIEGVSLEGLSLPGNLLAPQLEEVQQQLEEQINEALAQVARLGGLELVYIATTEDLLILDFNFSLAFYQLEPESE